MPAPLGLEGGTLASPIGAEQGDDFPPSDRERHAIHGYTLAIANGEVLDLERNIAHMGETTPLPADETGTERENLLTKHTTAPPISCL